MFRTQRITQVDINHGRIRIPVGEKADLPASRSHLSVVLRGVRFDGVRWDPRFGPDRERSGIIGVGRRLRELVTHDEVLAGRVADGTVTLGDSETPATPAEPMSMRATRPGSVPTDWIWEGNVLDAVAAHLEREGWGIVHRANTARREPGPDIDARQLRRMLLVEVKGYPSNAYRDPNRAGERKPTNPKTQAHHWFAQGLLQVARHRSGSDVEVALALPSADTYDALISETEKAFRLLRIGVLIVREDGSVETRLPHAPREPGPD
jgi:hypothetical protein